MLHTIYVFAVLALTHVAAFCLGRAAFHGKCSKEWGKISKAYAELAAYKGKV